MNEQMEFVKHSLSWIEMLASLFCLNNLSFFLKIFFHIIYFNHGFPSLTSPILPTSPSFQLHALFLYHLGKQTDKKVPIKQLFT